MLGIIRPREDPLGECRFLSLLQQFCHTRGQYDLAVSFARFRFSDDINSACIPHRPLNAERAVFLVEVAPFESADLTSAHAGHDRRVEEVVPYLVALECLHEGFDLRFEKDRFLGFLVLRNSRSFGRIERDQSILHRSVHRFVQKHVHRANG